MNNPEDVEVIQSFGNTLLVSERGEIKQIEGSGKNKLLYEHGLKELFHTDDWVTISESPSFSIRATQSDDVYNIEFEDNPPILTPPPLAETVLENVHRYIETENQGLLRDAYEQTMNHYDVRRDIMSPVSHMFGPDVVHTEQGWEVLGLFFVTWEGKIFLNTDEEVEEKVAYRPVSDGVRRLESPRGFIELTHSGDYNLQQSTLDILCSVPDGKQSDRTEKVLCPVCDTARSCDVYSHGYGDVFECQSCRTAWQEVELQSEEAEVVKKTKWLIDYRDRYDDATYWDIVESAAGFSPRGIEQNS